MRGRGRKVEVKSGPFPLADDGIDAVMGVPQSLAPNYGIGHLGPCTGNPNEIRGCPRAPGQAQKCTENMVGLRRPLQQPLSDVDGNELADEHAKLAGRRRH